MAGRHTNTVGRQRDRQSRTVQTGRETDDHDECRQTYEQRGQAARQTNSADRQRDIGTVRTGRETAEQCGQYRDSRTVRTVQRDSRKVRTVQRDRRTVQTVQRDRRTVRTVQRETDEQCGQYRETDEQCGQYRETDEQCEQAETQTDSAGRQRHRRIVRAGRRTIVGRQKRDRQTV